MRRWPQGLEGDGKVIAGISWKKSKEVEDSSWLDLNTKLRHVAHFIHREHGLCSGARLLGSQRTIIMIMAVCLHDLQRKP